MVPETGVRQKGAQIRARKDITSNILTVCRESADAALPVHRSSGMCLEIVVNPVARASDHAQEKNGNQPAVAEAPLGFHDRHLDAVPAAGTLAELAPCGVIFIHPVVTRGAFERNQHGVNSLFSGQ